jgi:hypothetical protein
LPNYKPQMAMALRKNHVLLRSVRLSFFLN